jgi:ribonuclease R
MLCANVATARFFLAENLPILYRVHEGPSEQKLENLRGFLGELGLDLSGGEKPGPREYQDLLAQVADRPDAHVIQTMMLRSLSQAVYQPENEGHFGLNYDGYAHFTSPIRRYPDLLVHRGIRRVIRSDIKSKHVLRANASPIPARQIFPYDVAAMVVMGEQCSVTERRADDATREVDAWLKCEYLQEHVGDEFDGVVAAVTSFGMFVELANIYIEGLVHISALPADYYHYDQGKQRLTGERSGRSFNLGDAVRVQVARVDLDDKKIDLELLGSHARKKGPGNRAASGKGKDKHRGKSTSPGKKGGKGSTPGKKGRKKGAKPGTRTRR